MKSAEFMSSRLSAIINFNGVLVKVYKNKKNDFDEQTGIDPESETEVKGIFHEATGWQSLNKSEGNVVHSVPKPFFLCMWKDAENIEQEDHIFYNGTEYIVNEVNNVQEYNVAADISLDEVVL